MNIVQSQILSFVSNSQLSSQEKEKFFSLIQKVSVLAQNMILQRFIQFPNKVADIWHIIEKKEKFISQGEGNLEALLEDELKIVSE